MDYLFIFAMLLVIFACWQIKKTAVEISALNKAHLQRMRMFDYIVEHVEEADKDMLIDYLFNISLGEHAQIVKRDGTPKFLYHADLWDIYEKVKHV